MSIIQVIVLVVDVAAIIVIAFFAFKFYKNMKYDKNHMKCLNSAGFIESQVTLEDGTVINYGEGPASGSALLLIHGQFASWKDYCKVLPELATQYHVFAIDCHGHGGSSKDKQSYSIEKMGKDISWFMENVIKEPTIIVSHSISGFLATWLAANYPDSVKALVIEDTPFFSSEGHRCEETFFWVDGFTVIHGFLTGDEECNLHYVEQSKKARANSALQAENNAPIEDSGKMIDGKALEEVETVADDDKASEEASTKIVESDEAATVVDSDSQAAQITPVKECTGEKGDPQDKVAYARYYFDHCYLQILFGDSWKDVKQFGLSRLNSSPQKPLRIFYLPEIMNRFFDIMYGDYDLEFGEAVYSRSWFEGFNQEEVLKKVKCPSLLIHAEWSFDENKVLLGAMTEEDAEQVHSLLPQNTLKSIDVGSYSHYDNPELFMKAMKDFSEQLR